MIEWFLLCYQRLMGLARRLQTHNDCRLRARIAHYVRAQNEMRYSHGRGGKIQTDPTLTSATAAVYFQRTPRHKSGASAP